MRFVRGFTLIELMVTIAVLAVIAMMAAPSMNGLIQKQQLQKKERELIGLLTEAKSMAIMKRTNVSVNLDSTDGNSDTTFNIKIADKPYESLTINTLSEDTTQGVFSGKTFTYNQNGQVNNLTQDALITLCNTDLKIKKQLVLTHLGSVFTKPEGTC